METVYVAKNRYGGFALVWVSQEFGAMGWSGPFKTGAQALDHAKRVRSFFEVDVSIEETEEEANDLYDRLHG